MKRTPSVILSLGIVGLALLAVARHRSPMPPAPSPGSSPPSLAAPGAAPGSESQTVASAPAVPVVLAAPGFDARFGTSGVEFDRPGHPSVRWGWAEVAGLQAASPRPLVRDGAHIFRDAGPIREHWEQRQEGIEHSITITEPPGDLARSPYRSGEFTVRMPIEGGLQPCPKNGNIALVDPEGTTVLAYENVKAFDSRGIPIPARMEVLDGAVEIRVRYLDATYPILIDPTVTALTTEAFESGDVLQRYQGHGSYPNYVSMRCCYANTWDWKRAFCDVDRNSNTGYRYGGVGAELMFENGSLYQYAGSGSDWTWTLWTDVTMNEAPVDGLNSSQWFADMAFFSYTVPSWGGLMTLLFEIERPGAKLTGAPYNYRHSGDHHYAPRSYSAENDGTRAYYTWDAGVESFTFRQVYIDSDANPSTGFAIRSTVGANFLIENGNLYRYTGTGGSWSWTRIGDSHQTMDGNTYHWWVDRSVLGLTNGSADVATLAFAGNLANGAGYVVEAGYIHEFTPVLRPTASAGWVQLSSGQVNSLNGVFFADASNGWAVGNAGTILRTTDGGATWARQPSGTTNALWRVQFLSTGRGWAVGDAGTILTTADGGTSWSPQTSGTTQAIRALSFVSSTTGWAVGTSGRILKTTNGGASWFWQTSGVTNNLFAVSFVHALKGWAAGDGVILSTSDGGTTWSRQPAQVQTSTGPIPLVHRDARFLSETRGILAGGGTPGAVLQTTTNGGASWTSAVREASPDHYRAIAFGDATNLWAVGAYGIIAASSDGGMTWTTQAAPTSARLSGVWFVNASTGWAVGDNGVILKTTTGGR